MMVVCSEKQKKQNNNFLQLHPIDPNVFAKPAGICTPSRNLWTRPGILSLEIHEQLQVNHFNVKKQQLYGVVIHERHTHSSAAQIHVYTDTLSSSKEEHYQNISQ